MANLRVAAGFTKLPRLSLAMSEILAREQTKITGMLNDLTDLKFFATGAQHRRLQEIEQALRAALLENSLELREGGAPAALSDA